MPLYLGGAGVPLRVGTDAAARRRIGVLVDAGSDGRRSVDVAQNARVVPFLGFVVEVRRRGERQQHERGNRA